jgi:1-acyl-sn-glycerol-3-phosphate acyltransferase
MYLIKPDSLRFDLTFYAQRAFMLPLVWFVYRVLNDVKVEGLEHLDAVEGQSVILAPNHTSSWDSWVGTVWALSRRRRFVDRGSYTCVLATPEHIPTPPLKLLTAMLGAIPVDRERGIEQDSLQDTVRIMREGKRNVVLTVYPEGTRSRDGFLRQKGKAGIGWLAHATGAPVVPIYHSGATRMPGIGMNLRLKIGAPMRFDQHQGQPGSPAIYRSITEDIMTSLRGLETEMLGRRALRRRAAARAAAPSRTLEPV